MANPNLQTRQSLTTAPNIDALQIKNAEGAVISWIDGTGQGQGNLSATSIIGGILSLLGSLQTVSLSAIQVTLFGINRSALQISDPSGKAMCVIGGFGDTGHIYIWLGDPASNPTQTNFAINYDTEDAGFEDLTLNCNNGNVGLTYNNGTGGFEVGTRTNGGCHSTSNLYVGTPPSYSAHFTDTLVLAGPHSPTSGATAGVTGEVCWDATNLYLCTAGGTAGNATWKKLVLQAN